MGSGFMARGSEFKVQGAGQGSELRVRGTGFGREPLIEGEVAFEDVKRSGVQHA